MTNNTNNNQTKISQETGCWGISSSNSKGRKYEEPTHPYRSAFQRDRDRIIHSTAFRRLQYKTQVFIVQEGDHFRTRLTHTTEVSQLSRTIARTLNANEDLIEAIALSHDLGHTPFGHAGEKALNQKLEDSGGFNHNSQTLRIVEQLENPYTDFRGLNLTWELRESIAKHGYPEPQEEAERFNPDLSPLLEAQIADTADSIAYCTHDLDDGLKSEVIDEQQLEDIPLWNEAKNQIQEEYGTLSPDQRRSQIVRYLINRMVTDLIDKTRQNLREHAEDYQEIQQVSNPLVQFSSELQEKKQTLQSFLYDNMYCHHKVIRMQERAKRIIRTLFDEFLRCPELLPEYYQEWLAETGKKRGIADYIAGMTDRSAIREYENLIP